MPDTFPSINFTTSQENEEDYLSEHDPKKVPVTFVWEGNKIRGVLSNVSGAGGNTWHLMINNFYCGALHWTPYRGFWFGSQTGEFEDSVDYFADIVIAWYG
jgi:hypothetical protein